MTVRESLARDRSKKFEKGFFFPPLSSSIVQLFSHAAAAAAIEIGFSAKRGVCLRGGDGKDTVCSHFERGTWNTIHRCEKGGQKSGYVQSPVVLQTLFEKMITILCVPKVPMPLFNFLDSVPKVRSP